MGAIKLRDGLEEKLDKKRAGLSWSDYIERIAIRAGVLPPLAPRNKVELSK